MTEHTPGPWTIGGKETINNVPHLVVQAIDRQKGNNSVDALCPGPNAEANARLIAAAPETAARAHDLANQVMVLEAEKAELVEALEFYADPDTYFAIGFFPDPPNGEFMDDFDDDHDPGYPKPGKRARDAIATATDQMKSWLPDSAPSPLSFK